MVFLFGIEVNLEVVGGVDIPAEVGVPDLVLPEVRNHRGLRERLERRKHERGGHECKSCPHEVSPRRTKHECACYFRRTAKVRPSIACATAKGVPMSTRGI